MAVNILSHPLLFLVGISSIIIILAFVRSRRFRSRHPLPPGPKGIPVFGNLFQLSPTPWKEFHEWKKAYGSLVYITAGGQGMLIVNTRKAAVSLFDNRGSLYGDRPRWILSSEILTRGMCLPFMRYSELFRRMRRAGHDALTKARVASYHPIQSKQAVVFTHEVLLNQDEWQSELARATTSTIVSIVYDRPEVSADDPLMGQFNDFTRAMSKGVNPAAAIVEYFPWLARLPSCIASWRRENEENFIRFNKLFEGLFQEVERRIDDGDERPSFSGTLIRERPRTQLECSEAVWLAATIAAGGLESTRNTISWFLLAMIVYGDKQRKCQAELDAVIGRSRMPTFKDRDSLPYIQATVREILRWRPVSALVPHCTREDDWYEGYFIPKGTLCFGNVWSINHDPEIYGSDADDFNPDRFIGEKGELLPPVTDTKDGHLTYGFGPRLCPGRHMANDSAFITITSLLWAADIAPARDDSGRAMIPDLSDCVVGELTMRPLPFKCRITPRFPEAISIVAQTRELS